MSALDPETQAARTRFLEFLPAIEKAVRHAFRHRHPDAREESVQEALANAYQFVLLLARRDELDRAFATPLARYAVARVRQGRRFGGGDGRRDPLSRRTRLREGLSVERLDGGGDRGTNWRTAVVVDDSTPVPDQAAFRIDFPAWLGSLGERGRSIAEDLAKGERTIDVAERFGVSRSRISMMRREFAVSWRRFHEPRAEPAHD